jgi:hypothetical protein
MIMALSAFFRRVFSLLQHQGQISLINRSNPPKKLISENDLSVYLDDLSLEKVNNP